MDNCFFLRGGGEEGGDKNKLTETQCAQAKITRARQYIWNKKWVIMGSVQQPH